MTPRLWFVTTFEMGRLKEEGFFGLGFCKRVFSENQELCFRQGKLDLPVQYPNCSNKLSAKDESGTEKSILIGHNIQIMGEFVGKDEKEAGRQTERQTDKERQKRRGGNGEEMCHLCLEVFLVILAKIALGTSLLS